MTEKERLVKRALELELEANGCMSAIPRWAESTNNLYREETVMMLSLQARVLMAQADGIREYLEREDD